jgi:flagellar biosynthesis anti-sigma factor FlgM
MRIDLNSDTAVSGAHAEKASSSHAAQISTVQKNSSQVTESEASVGKLAAAALSAPEVRSEKIASLQKQINAGTYQVSADQVAGSMLEQMRVH